MLKFARLIFLFYMYSEILHVLPTFSEASCKRCKDSVS